VESIIESHVQAVLKDSPSLQHHIVLVGKLVDALESDATWVGLYGITGELIVPDIHKEQGEIGELLKKARQVNNIVCSMGTLCLMFHFNSFWRSIDIQNPLQGVGEKLKYQSTFQA